ncbi:AMP-binding protein [Kriegella aquimaris]|uniref:O-succinylbenzoic acid--CoA ligase n=1 Tax=Kriegella aquimaris TaxID=192904 RepID=A0A1G9NJZ0_9FLAO|nr:AMP-binding protein [Kriegella aquimaris]SDL86906.1 O-succinylbenzoic acid--CoA ligase [Kriegella aquimaris]
MEPIYSEVHSKFKLNGITFSKEDLKEVGYSLVKEGEQYEHNIGDFLLDWLNDSPEILVRTSGSTGTPKNIALEKRFMVNSAVATGQFFGLEAGQTALLCLPADYIAGKMMLVRAMVLGLELDYIESSSKPLEGILKSYDFCAMVPLQLEGSLDKIEQIKTLIVGGAPISDVLRNQLQDKSTAIFETYGMTETVTHIAARKVNNLESTAVGELNNGRVEHPFKTLPNISVSKDSRGCLVIDSPNVSREPVATNDFVELVSDVEFRWLGRFDNAINSGGIKLIPEQIEAKLVEIVDGRFFVAGLSDEKLGQKLVLIVEGDVDAKALLNKINSFKKLDKFEVPKQIYGIHKFKETDSGKIKRTETIRLISSISRA